MAISTYENLVSNLSYTEKDFQTIYPALLDLVKKETVKWDPSASNESDPGVLLLKLNAIIADKCNYNIDKNALECFPLSVTQEKNARQLFEQLGYFMHWYRAAETMVTLKYIGEKITDENGNVINVEYQIPMFTMVSDDNNETVYTIVDNKTISTSGTAQLFYALQGVKEEFKINGSALITTANLDSNNRLYFTDTRVAENGIFITNAVDSKNYSDWIRKDNLLVEEVSAANHFYKFGVSQDLNTCYLEFPENVQELFQDGINITYIRTDGEDGNIAAQLLDTFYSDVSSIVPVGTVSEEVVGLTTDVISIKNYIAGSNGRNPETINEAYIGYKKTIGTFDTLVTLRDYMNAVRNSQYVSNALVCDRTNDVQSSYNIITEAGSVEQTVTEVERFDTYDYYGYIDGTPELYTGIIWDANFYLDEAKSEIVSPDTSKNYYNYTTEGSYRVIYQEERLGWMPCDPVAKDALNAFDLKMYLLTANSIVSTPEAYNSTFDLNVNPVIDAIVKAEIDEYKCVQHNFVDILLDKICFLKNKYPIKCKIIPQYALTDVQKKEVVANIKQALYDNLKASEIEFGADIVYEDVYNIILNADSRIKALALDRFEYSTYVVFLGVPKEGDPDYDPKDKNLGEYRIRELSLDEWILKYNEVTGEAEVADSIINDFRTEIYAKSVIAGKTQFFIKDTEFDFGVNQKYQLLERQIGRLETNLDVTLNDSNSWTYTMRENESIQLFAPNLLEVENYSSNIRFEYFINGANLPIKADSSYMLQAGEYMIFYWSEDSTADSGYNYAVYGEKTIITPSFTLDNSVSTKTKLIGNDLTAYCEYRTVNNQEFLYANGNTLNETSASSLTAKIKAMTSASNILSGSKSISIKVKNSVTITSEGYCCYWVLNERDGDEYVLFDEAGEKSRILQADEYFIYTTSDKSDMCILGAGTLITRENTDRLACTAINYSEIVANGLAALVDYWKILPDNYPLDITEMQYLAFGDGVIVNIQPNNYQLGIANNDIELNTKYEYYLKNNIVIPEDAESATYTLTDGEYILFYTNNSGNYKYKVYGSGSTITTKFNLTNSATSVEQLAGKDLVKNCKDITLYTKTTLPEGMSDLTFKYAEGITNAAQTIAVDKITTVVENQIIIKAYNAPKISEIKLNSKTYTALNNCTIKYKENVSSTSWIYVPNMLLNHADYTWQALTLLRLNLSNTKPQIILPITTDTGLITSQSVTYYRYDATNQWVIDETKRSEYTAEEWELVKPGTIDPAKEPFKAPTYLLTSVLLNSAGMESETGRRISTLYYDENDEIQSIAIYAYILDNNPDKNITFLSSGDTQIVFSATPEEQKVSQQHDLHFKLPAGNYIIPVMHAIDYGTLEELKLYMTNSKTTKWVGLKTMADISGSMPEDEASNLALPGNYYLCIKDLPDDTDSGFYITIRVMMKYKSGKESITTTVLIPPIFKYSDSTSLYEYDDKINAELFIRIYNKIKELDYHQLFNYTHVVDKDVEIAYPLNPNTYVDTNHVMNQYTICQMDIENNDLYVTNTVRSY